MREAYIICEADIIPEGYITRFDRNGYHCKNLFCPIDKRGFYLAQKERLARLCLAFATRKPIVFGFAEGVRVSLFEELASSVLVFQVFPSCGAQRNLRAVRLLDFFDRCANSRSLFPPPAAVALIARAGTGARYGFHYQTIK